MATPVMLTGDQTGLHQRGGGGYTTQTAGYPQPQYSGQPGWPRPLGQDDKHGRVRSTRPSVGARLAAVLAVCWCCTWPCHGPCCGGF